MYRIVYRNKGIGGGWHPLYEEFTYRTRRQAEKALSYDTRSICWHLNDPMYTGNPDSGKGEHRCKVTGNARHDDEMEVTCGNIWEAYAIERIEQEDQA